MSEPPILEPQAIAHLRSISPDDDGRFVRELVNLFLSDTPKRIAEMQVALARNSVVEVGREAHAIKGSAANFGAARLVALCLELEQLGRTNALAAASSKVLDLQAEFERTRAALESLRIGA